MGKKNSTHPFWASKDWSVPAKRGMELMGRGKGGENKNSHPWFSGREQKVGAGMKKITNKRQLCLLKADMK